LLHDTSALPLRIGPLAMTELGPAGIGFEPGGSGLPLGSDVSEHLSRRWMGPIVIGRNIRNIPYPMLVLHNSFGRAASSSGCVGTPRGHETGLTGYAE